MKMKHIILEIYCDCEAIEKEELPCYSIYKDNELGKHCFESRCKFLSYVDSPNELAYSGDNGIVKEINDFIGFGGEMDTNVENSDYEEIRQKLLTKWGKICRNKISQAYDEYMNEKEEI